MAHYAFIDEDNIVVEVITGRNEADVDGYITDWEEYYTTKREGLRALRTSYNTLNGEHTAGGVPFRGNYAGIGYTYDEALDAFIPPKPYPSWVLDEQIFNWSPPIPYPEDGEEYGWDEISQSWTTIED